jgi:hypothetical protein
MNAWELLPAVRDLYSRHPEPRGRGKLTVVGVRQPRGSRGLAIPLSSLPPPYYRGKGKR